MKRRTLLNGLVSTGAAALGVRSAFAAAYPSAPIKILVGFPAGGTTDAIIRVLAVAVSKDLGQPVIIENRAGAGSVISMVAAKNSKPDGYTLVLATTGTFSMPIQNAVGYDPIADFTYIIRLTHVLFGVVVRADSPFKTFQDLVAFAQANPGKLSYGAPVGLGNTAHLAMTEVANKAHIDWTPIPYKGSADTSTALLGGEIAFAPDGSGGFAPLVESGRARLLVMLSSKRSPRWNTIPTLKELGYDISFDSPWGIAGPAGMDKAVVKRLYDAFRKGMDDPTVQERLSHFGQATYILGPDEYSKYAREEYAAQRKLLTKYGFAKPS